MIHADACQRRTQIAIRSWQFEEQSKCAEYQSDNKHQQTASVF